MEKGRERKGKEGKGTSTLHCQGKNGRSKTIGQTNQKMIHFVPNMYVSGKISALRPGTQTVMNFGTTKKIRKLPKTTIFQDLRVFAGFLRFFLRGFAGLIPSRLMRCKHLLAFVSPNPKTCNQSPKIQDLGVLGKISRYRSNSENTYIFLGFGGSRKGKEGKGKSGKRNRWRSASLAARTAADGVGATVAGNGWGEEAAGDERAWLRGRLRTAWVPESGWKWVGRRSRW